MQKRIWFYLMLILTLVFGCGREDPLQPDSQPSQPGITPGEVTDAKDLPILGEQNVAVVTVAFEDDEGVTFDGANLDLVHDIMFGETDSVDSLYAEMSDNAVRYRGDVFGPYSIPYASVPFADDDWVEAVAGRARAEITNFDIAYQYYVYVFPRRDHYPYGGLGGLSGNTIKIFEWNAPSVYGHEFGHTHGWGESMGPGGIYTDLSCIMSWWISQDCTKEERTGLPLRHACAMNQIFSGWITPDRIATIETKGNHVVNLAPTERPSSGVVSLEGIEVFQCVTFSATDPEGVERNIYISYRHEEGDFYPVDEVLVDDLMNRIHVYHGTPGEGAVRIGVIGVGAIFEWGSFTVRPLASDMSSEGIDYVPVEITLIDQAPAVGVSSDQWGTNDPVAGDRGATFTVTVTNNAEAGCLPTTYDIELSEHTSFTLSTVTGIAQVELEPGETQVFEVGLVFTDFAADDRHLCGIGLRDTVGVQCLGRQEFIYEIDIWCPTIPEELRISTWNATVTLGWRASWDHTSGVDHYEIWRQSDVDCYFASSTPSYLDESVSENMYYAYYVRAVDGFGWMSDWSAAIGITTGETVCEVLPLVEIPVVTIYDNIDYGHRVPDKLGTFTISLTKLNETVCPDVEFQYTISEDTACELLGPVPEGPGTLSLASGESGEIPIQVHSFGGAPDNEAYRILVEFSGGYFNEDYVLTFVRDTEQPSVPGNVTATATTVTSAVISWSASTDNLSQISHYTVFRGSDNLGTTESLNFTDETIPGDGVYAYQVLAADNAGNLSGQSVAISLIVDTTPPVPPANLIAERNDCEIDLAWDPAIDDLSAIASYEIWRNGTAIAQTIDTGYVDVMSSMNPGQSFSYLVLAVDTAGQISDLSAPASVQAATITISNVRVKSQNALNCTVTIGWTTDVPATSLVSYGATCGAMGGLVTDHGMTTNHSVVIPVHDYPSFAYKVMSADGCVTGTSACKTFRRGRCMGR